MKPYHKIQTCFLRDEVTHKILEGQWTTPEFLYLKDLQWVGTEKVDGTNIRIIWDGENVTIKGKTDEAQIPPKLMDALKKRFYSPSLFDDVFGLTPVCLYGEGYGVKIQGGGNYRKDNDFVLFDVNIGGTWLRRMDVINIGLSLTCPVVPQTFLGTLPEAIEAVRTGQYSIWGDFIAEGLVLTPEIPLLDRMGQRIITKIKHKDFKN